MLNDGKDTFFQKKEQNLLAKFRGELLLVGCFSLSRVLGLARNNLLHFRNLHPRHQLHQPRDSDVYEDTAPDISSI